ncbi:MAG: phenylacetate--CoA ligase family protein [Bacillaceae bacterium]|nr:phenylacetate--CoA ligase family protein [Bacillaceae bacterium]
MNATSFFIRHALFPVMEKVKGNRIRAYLSELMASQWHSSEQIQAYRMEKLKKLLLHAVEHVPAYHPYRELRPAIEQNPAEALKQFPILTKQAFQSKHQDYISQAVNQSDLIQNRTGGSTGEPVSFYMDRYTVEHYEAARWRGLSWHGIRIGDPSVMIWGSPIELSQQQQKKYELKERFLKNRIMIPAYELRSEKLDEYLEQMNRFRPDYLYGYASALHLLATLVKKSGKQLSFPLKGVVSTAETLFDHQREEIQDVFGCPVINEYGARDGGMIAYECPQGSMHIQAENLWIEVIDLQSRQPVDPGQEGLILVTDLHNLAMPRLRYQIGDVGALGNRACSCGRGLPVLEKVGGREEDIFVGTDGHYIHGHLFTHIARNLNEIQQFQVIQHKPDQITLKIVVSDGDRSRMDRDVRTFVDQIKEKVGNPEVHVEYVSEIPVSASGKVRPAIREFAL